MESELILTIIDSLMATWSSSLSPHVSTALNERFATDMHTLKESYITNKFERVDEIVNEWHVWSIGQSNDETITAPSLAFFDLEELFLQLQTALHEERKA